MEVTMYYVIRDEDYIAHYGVGHLHGGHSGRFPWGSGDRPKQDAASTSGSSQSSYEERKQQALKSGSASDVLKYRGDLTNKELNDAVQRIRFEQELERLDYNSSSMRDVEKTVGKVYNVVVKAAAGVAAYNILATVYNETYAAANGKKKLPVFKVGKKG